MPESQKARKQKQKQNKIRKSYGKWDYLLLDKPVRQRELILLETVIPSAPKTGSKFTGNE